MTSEAMRGAQELESTQAYGRQIGLGEQAISEVIDTWIGYYSQRPATADWLRIRDKLTDRRYGHDWRPRDTR